MLTHSEILKNIEEGHIVIKPFDKEAVGTNSIDLHLGDILIIYKEDILDCKKNNDIEEITIPDEGIVLEPHKLYLGVTAEYTETAMHIPQIEGKSSIGRLGLFVHTTAGLGDIGFKGHWTLGLICHQPIRIYKGMRISQLYYLNPHGEISNRYDEKKGAKYLCKIPKPAPSKMYLNFDQNGKSN